MIQDRQELSGSLRYLAGWADLLEGLRRHAKETDTTLLPITMEGPISELRRVLAEAREFVDASLPEESRDYHLPNAEERQKAA